jgi:hypothetical protein
VKISLEKGRKNINKTLQNYTKKKGMKKEETPKTKHCERKRSCEMEKSLNGKEKTNCEW